MDVSNATLHGLWLPLVTPFRDGALDEASLKRLAAHFAAEPVDGLILAATTGEGMCLDEDEVERLVSIVGGTLDAAGKRLPLYLGLSGSDTRKVVKALAQTASWPIDGYLIACPYYTRPSQQGLFQHYAALADGTEKPIVIYNIPYRTGVNLGNETMLRLAERSNIVGVKDCCADAAQSFDLLRHRPEGFSVLVGDDPLFYSAIAQGADGGITASAHVHTRSFAGIRNKLDTGDREGALKDWYALADVPRLLFAEPSPAPVKHWLWRSGLIDSPELRLPMVLVTPALAQRIDRAVKEISCRAAD
ncbi:MAG: 4-hydroxy-tetrahydrodipicolinate synthase [Hyphomicrobiales bacterium]